MNRRDDAMCSLLVDVVSGDPRARGLLWSELATFCKIANLPQLAALEEEESEARENLFALLMEKLEEQDCRRLRMFVAQLPTKPKSSAFGWLKVVLTRLTIDYVRAHPSNIGTRDQVRIVETVPFEEAASTGAEVSPRDLELCVLLAKITKDPVAVRAFYLRHVEGASWAQVARLVGAPTEGAIRARVGRALEMVREISKEQDERDEHQRLLLLAKRIWVTR
jgi:DNA-directed RNA polymerase specialized sigma24 family protein